jgi:MFS family permease
MAVPLFGGSVGIFALSITIWTVGEIGNTPIASALVAQLAPAHLRGRYQGVYQIAWSGSSVLAPLTGGAAFAAFGGTPVWLACAAIPVVSAAGLIRLAPALTGRVAQATARDAVPLAKTPEPAASPA